jgi:hypothetical protein
MHNGAERVRQAASCEHRHRDRTRKTGCNGQWRTPRNKRFQRSSHSLKERRRSISPLRLGKQATSGHSRSMECAYNIPAGDKVCTDRRLGLNVVACKRRCKPAGTIPYRPIEIEN